MLPKTKLKATKFKVGDKIVVRGEDGKDYLKGKIISLAQDMHIEATILEYSNYIRYPKGMKDVFIMGRKPKNSKPAAQPPTEGAQAELNAEPAAPENVQNTC